MEIQSLESYMNRNPPESIIYRNDGNRVLVYRNGDKIHKRREIAAKIDDLPPFHGDTSYNAKYLGKGDFLGNEMSLLDVFYRGCGRFEVVADNSCEFKLNEEQLGKLRRSFCEAKVLEMMNGTPFIVPFRDYKLVFDRYGSLYSILQTQDVGGESLGELVKSNPQTLSLVEGIRVIADVAAALYEVHAKNIIHRDVKPSNIHFSRERQMASLLDFGIAFPLCRLAKPKGEMMDSLATLLEEVSDVDGGSGNVSGSPSYFSPEQAWGIPTEKIDIFALGLVGYFMFTGQHAFQIPESGGLDKDMARYFLKLEDYTRDDKRRSNLMKDLVKLGQKRFSQKLPPIIIDAIEQALDKDPNKRNLYPLDEAARDYLAEFIDTSVITVPPSLPLPTEEDIKEMTTTTISTRDIVAAENIF